LSRKKRKAVYFSQEAALASQMAKKARNQPYVEVRPEDIARTIVQYDGALYLDEMKCIYLVGPRGSAERHKALSGR
jgi:hypothetical protein